MGIAALTVLLNGACATLPARAAVRSCPTSTATIDNLMYVLSVRNMSCGAALRVLELHDAKDRYPFRNVKIGSYRCDVYDDRTQHGQDSNIRVRCVHGSHAFRFAYGA